MKKLSKCLYVLILSFVTIAAMEEKISPVPPLQRLALKSAAKYVAVHFALDKFISDPTTYQGLLKDLESSIAEYSRQYVNEKKLLLLNSEIAIGNQWRPPSFEDLSPDGKKLFLHSPWVKPSNLPESRIYDIMGNHIKTIKNGIDITWSPDSLQYVYVDCNSRTVKISNLFQPDQLHVMNLQKNEHILSFQWSNNGRYLIIKAMITGGRIITTFDTYTRQILKSLTTKLPWCSAYFISDDAQLLLVQSDLNEPQDDCRKIMTIYDLITQKQIKSFTLGNCAHVSVSPVGSHVVCDTVNMIDRVRKNALSIWNSQRDMVQEIPISTKGFDDHSVQWSHDGTRFLFYFIRYHARSLAILLSLNDHEYKKISEFEVEDFDQMEHTGFLYLWSKDDAYIAGANGKYLCIYDGHTGKLEEKIEGNYQVLGWTDDGKLITLYLDPASGYKLRTFEVKKMACESFADIAFTMLLKYKTESFFEFSSNH